MKEKSSIRIKKALSIRNMTRGEFIKKSGISKSLLSMYLAGKTEPRQDKLTIMGKALNVSEVWLMGYDVPMERVINPNREKIEIEGLEDVTDKYVMEKIKTYKFFSSGVGSVDLNDYKEEYYMLEKELFEKILKNGYVFIIYDQSMEPLFFETDTMVMMKKKLSTWEELDSKLLLLKLDGKTFIKKLYFNDGIPYLHTFNERVFPSERMDKYGKVELIGILELRLVQEDLSKLKV